MKIEPQRMCICCRKMFGKKVLKRIVKNNLLGLAVDITGRSGGRGFYVCDNEECMKKILNAKFLKKSQDIEMNDEQMKRFKEELCGTKQN